jgi:hypothetical protein
MWKKRKNLKVKFRIKMLKKYNNKKDHIYKN